MSAYSLRSFLSFCVLFFFAATSLPAQQAPVVRVTQAVDPSVRVTLPGNTHPLARAEFDQGEAPADLPMKRMLLVLKRSPEQEAALLQLLDSQQDKHSPSYHRWVTPQEFGAKFGPADSDVAAVSNWLKSSGFQVSAVSVGRTVIEFSGTAAQVQAAFHTSIHKFVVNGKQHWANANDPQIPAALLPVVAGVHTLHNFLKQPQLGKIRQVAATFTKEPVPQVTFPGTPPVHALGPADFAKIYNSPAIPAGGIDGTGVTIAVVARSAFDPFDVQSFRGLFGLSGNLLQLIPNGDQPGNLGGGEAAEATLDATWSGAAAPGANIVFVISATTNTTDGVDLSELYIVDHNLADIMTESFGQCEANFNSAQAAATSSLAEQAAAQGITYTVSTGDSGAEGCDRPSSPSAAGPVSASLLSGTPFNVAVGGTMFNEGSQVSKYWGTSPPVAETALSYIPENVWNESCSSTQCGANANLAATGGGVNTFFSKPSWQSGVTGIPADGKRDQPDVSLTAAFHDPYLVCFQGSCSQNRIFFFSGTSASAPSFAGIMALVDQKMGGRQGLANYVLYRLAAADIAAGRKCNASSTTLPASSCTFNDVTTGNNAVPGEAGFGTASGKYQAATGYDLATGLGSVNVTNLLNNWASVTFTPTTTTLALNPKTITHGAPVTVNITVSPNSGTGVPTGDVSLRNADAAQLSGSGLIDLFTLSGGAVTAQTTNLLPGGTYHVLAHYAGDQTFAPSDSAASATITVSPEASVSTLQILGVNPTTGQAFPYVTAPFGSPVFFRADVSGVSGNGLPSGFLNFLDNGSSFWNAQLNSQGTATTPPGWYSITPGTHSIVAQYFGDSSFTTVSSAPTSMTVTKAPTTGTLTSDKVAVAEGTFLGLTFNLGTSSFSGPPTGTVTFLSGATPIASANNPAGVVGVSGSGNLQTDQFTVATGVANLSSALPVGQDTVTAQYSGDSNYAASTSAPITINVLADFDFSAAGSPVTVSQGASGVFTLTIAGHTGYNSTVNFTGTSCTGLPSESSCSFSPMSVVGSGTTTLTIKTTAPSAARLTYLSWWSAASGGMFAGLFLLGSGRKRRSRLLTCLLFSSLIPIVACGGGSSGPPPNPGTTIGSYNVTVRAADSAAVFTHTTVVMLNVQK